MKHLSGVCIGGLFCSDFSFIFSLNDDFNFTKFKCLNKEREVFHSSTFVDFGRDDLLIKIKSN